MTNNLNTRRSLKEMIREKLDDQEIFAYYINKVTGSELRLGRAIRSPLRSGDRNPSFNVYRSKSGVCRFKDFAGEEGDIFDFVQKLFNVDFKQACEIIASDFGVSENSNVSYLKVFRQVNVQNFPRLERRERTKVEVEYFREPYTFVNHTTPHSRIFWENYRITPLALAAYKVKRVRWFKIGNYEKTFHAEDYMIFGYSYEDPAAVRLYCPNEKNKKYKHIGNANGEDIFGLDVLKSIASAKTEGRVPLAILAAGQKDCLSIYSNTGVIAICLNSESCNLSKEQYLDIMKYTEKLMVLYDNDATGIKYAQKLHEKYGLDVIDISRFTKQKDISDYYKNEIKNSENDQLWEILKKTISG